VRYMVIERFKQGQARAIYERARDKGRLLPQGLEYEASWVSSELDLCFQLMECTDDNLFDEWMRRWNDLVDFEVIPVISSEDASAAILGGNEDSPTRAT
jgi:hypothetical protein